MSNRLPGGLPSAGGIRSTRKVPVLPLAATGIMLEKLPSQNLEISQIIHRETTVEQGYTKVTLRGVPRFLIDAFARILEEGKSVEGLFRKEGNQARMKNAQDIYNCKESVRDPKTSWTIHDICSIVKRFLRDLKTPLITPEIKQRLFEYAKSHPDGRIEPHRLTILFEPTFSDKGIQHPMPAEHIGTLGFIMRQLNELSRDSSVHQMNVQNLATVFAPTIFRDGGVGGSGTEAPKTPKLVSGKGALSLQKSMEENELRIAATVVLIKNSQWIGVPSNFYLTSGKESGCTSTDAAAAVTVAASAAGCSSSGQTAGWSRSHSLRPSHSMYGAAALAALPVAVSFNKAEKGGSVSGRKIEKRHSVKMAAMAGRGRTEEKDPKDRRRSSSTIREIFTRLRRKSVERKSPSRQPSPTGAAAAAAAAAGGSSRTGSYRERGGGGSSRGRSPAKKMLLEIDDHAVSALAAPLDHYQARDHMRSAVATGRPSLKSSSFLHPSNKAASMPGRGSVKQPQQAAAAPAAAAPPHQPLRPTRPPPAVPDVASSSSSLLTPGVCTIEEWQKVVMSPSEKRRVSGGSPVAAAAAARGDGEGVVPAPRRSITMVRDEPNSILGDEFFNPSHKFPVNRVRRHTAPIKTGLALRRNQPNTVHSGLKGPAMIRRATMAAADEKENSRSMIRVIARRRPGGGRGGDDEMEEDDWADEEDDTLTDSNRTMTSGGVAVVYPAEMLLEMTHLESRARRANFRRRKSGGGGSSQSSKSCITPVKDGENGEAESGGAAAAVERAGSSKSPGPPPLPQCSPPNSAERGTRAGAGSSSDRRRSSKRAVGEEEDVEMAPPQSLPTTASSSSADRTSSSSRTMTGGSGGERGKRKESSPHLHQQQQQHHFAVPALPVGRTASVPIATFATPSLSRKPIASTPLTTKPSPIGGGVAHSPLGRRGSSASALDSPQFKPPSSLATRRQTSAGDKDFVFSERNRAAILEAHNPAELQMHSKVGARPSVALIRNNNKGMVAARVNLFASIQSTSDAENASMRSSLGSSRHSLSGLDDTLATAAAAAGTRGGPPVGHSIMSSGGSSSGSSSKRSSIASHR